MKKAILFTALAALVVLAGAGSKAASKVYRTETVYDPISVPAITLKKAPVYTSDLTTRKKISSAEVSIAKNTSVTIAGEKNVNSKKWFKIKFVHNKKNYSGYVKNSYIQLKNTGKITAKSIGITTPVKVRAKAEESTALKSGGTKVTLANSTSVKVVEETYVGTVKWYKISFTFNKKTVTGFVKPKYVQLKKKKRKVKIYALTQAEFEEEMKKQGIPDEYKQYLRILHETYPFWEFRVLKTGIKWSTALKNEAVVGRNLIPNSKSKAWKSTDEAAYDKKTGKWKIFDGTTWVAASKAAVAYYMDPRNFLNERTIYQFELQAYQSEYQTASTVEKVFANTPFAGKKFSYTDPITGKSAKIKYSKAYISAAKNSGVSPIHLASRTKQEVVTSATTTSDAVTGKNKKYPGIYNFYNIGATSGKNALEKGLKWASDGDTYLRPWKDPYRSIVGGAQFIGSGYINRGQNTVYLEKFNMTEKDRYVHQYMTNVEAAAHEASKIKTAYSESGLLEKTPLVFSIPYYEKMPENPCPVPQ